MEILYIMLYFMYIYIYNVKYNAYHGYNVNNSLNRTGSSLRKFLCLHHCVLHLPASYSIDIALK